MNRRVSRFKTFEHPIRAAVNKRDCFKENWDKVIEIPIALGETGFFAFIVSKWRLTKKALKKINNFCYLS